MILFIQEVIAMKLHSSNLNPKLDVDRKVTISSLSKTETFQLIYIQQNYWQQVCQILHKIHWNSNADQC